MTAAMWKKMLIPLPIQQKLLAENVTPLALHIHSHMARQIRVIDTNDPSGPDGTQERHLSVSVEFEGLRVWPSRQDIRMVKEHLGIGQCEILKRKSLVVHIWPK